uniref:inositol hexakisphosphate and diphosphoinositol-pentakisphosphate kinase 2 isoform X9 n=1 Tax=Anopheles coluzzii TaxID=1518534 RepID=UPI0020FF8674|nr:inositol hexakisphosphate and diphosphoinositol-pentakisphosphate kinase 2 isoform X9 [Anopheles coluzzii]
MEWSWLRDWWRLAKFRRGDRTDPMTAGQRDRRRASGSGAAVSGFTGSALPDIADSMQELEPVRFFVDRLDDSCDDASDDDDAAQRPAVDGEEGEQERRHHYHHPDRHLYFGATDAFYDDPYCDCEKCLNGDLDPTDGLDSDDSSTSGKQVVVAVCAMSKKSQSKPMKEILTRLQEFEYIRMVVIGEEIILNEPVDRWPLCDCLISFHSKGFPLEKAIQYAQLRQPYVINNLHMQFDIQDRRRVYAILQQEGIEIPRYAVLDRDSPDPKQHELVESEDHVEVNGIVFNKPFVEKPVSAEDHNIYIYYPTSAGGGSQRLFRKIGSRSSVYSPESRVRKTGSFIYEDFMPTDGTDVKVYTVGPDYAHAEARKSPALDGKVERDSDGKEIRYPVILSNAEKLISRKVCLAFKQTVCGFDLLRANGKSFVCDVNGFSFVKNSNKYYDDCAKILGNMILRELAPQLHIPWSVPFQLDDPPIVPTTFGKMMELRCVTAVIRHGDRTPKQKMKVEVRHQKFFEIFEKYDGYRYGHIKLKRPKQLQEILDIARSLLAEIQTKAADSEIEEKQSKLEQLKSVLEMYGHFSGINRKVQMKYQPKGRPRGSSSDDGKQDCSTFVFVSDAPKEPSLVLILKWGGELTPAGRIQAEELGRIFRCMYPGGQSRQPGVGEGPGAQGLGLLRLHSTFRHDLKIYASDEGRVQMTAAAFAKGLLALEGELTPILVQMVKSANTNGLLDNDCDSSKYQNMAKSRLHELMQIDREFTAEDRDAINPGNAISINLAMNFVKNPVQCCAQVHSLIRSLMAVVAVKRDDPKTRDAVLYHGETWELMGRRWGKIEKDFCTKNKNYDISKIPDIYDCIKYDLQHNQHTLQFDLAEELYISAKYLADIVIPQEYGLTMHEKLTIGQGICTPLLKKIRADLQRNIEELGGEESVNRLNPRYSHGVSSPGRHVRTRLYFTSESHVHSLLTVLRHGGLLNVLTDEQWRRAMDYVSMVSELNYMSQIVIMLYEDPMKDPSSEERFHVELHFSPGVNCCVQKNLPPGPGFRPHSRNDSVTSKNASGDEDTTSRIDEENDTEEESSFSNNSSLHHTPSKTLPRTDADFGNIVASAGSANVKERRVKKMKSSSPIPIGSCHTVSGHEAMDLAKRLSEELAVQQQHQLQQQQHQLQQQQHPYHHHHHQQQQKHLYQQHHHHLTGSFGCGGNAKDITRPLSPDSEPRARSFEHQQQHHHHGHQHHHHHGKMHHHRSKGGKGALTMNTLRAAAERCQYAKMESVKDLLEATGFGGVPPIRPLETLHNALSLKQLDAFLERMTIGPLFKTPASSPPPKHPLISGGPIALKGSLSVVSHDSIGEGIGSGSGSMQPPSSIVAATTLGSGTKTAEERTAASRAGTRNAGAAVGSTTVAAGMPGPNGNSTPANGGAQQSWSDHSSSMTSSISALSSGGPSSPNYSEVYSRGCPSSDMSASITSSTDGSLAAIASGPGEQLVALPHLFSASAQISSPKHPGSVELNKGGEDPEAPRQLDEPPGATGLLLDDGTRRRGSAMDVSTGDLTPVSACSDWGDSNTNDATKGSITNYDLTTANTTEEEDEDATISTDTCLSVGEQQHHQQCCLMPCTGMDASFASSSSIKEGSGMVSVNSSAVGKKVSPFRGALPFDEPLNPADGGSDPHELDTSKSENRVVRGFRIQRQISLYENQKEEGKSVSQQQVHDWCGGGGSKSDLPASGRQQQQQPLSRLHMSFDELTHSDRNTTPAGRLAQSSITSSAAAAAPPPPPIPHTPGALVIREGFIEPPRLTRVTKSFHGKTNHQRFGVEEQQHGSESTPDGGYRRASDGPVATTGTARYSKTTLRPQHSSAAGVSSRFTTSIVQEPEQLRATEPDTEPSAASSKTK